MAKQPASAPHMLHIVPHTNPLAVQASHPGLVNSPLDRGCGGERCQGQGRHHCAPHLLAWRRWKSRYQPSSSSLLLSSLELSDTTTLPHRPSSRSTHKSFGGLGKLPWLQWEAGTNPATPTLPDQPPPCSTHKLFGGLGKSPKGVTTVVLTSSPGAAGKAGTNFFFLLLSSLELSDTTTLPDQPSSRSIQKCVGGLVKSHGVSKLTRCLWVLP